MAIVFDKDAGLRQGLQQGLQGIFAGLDKAQERSQMNRILGLQPQEAPPIQENEGFRQQFLDIVNQQETQTGQEFTPQQLDSAWNQYVEKAKADQAQQPQAKGQMPQYSTQQLAFFAQKYPQLTSFLQKQEALQQEKDYQQAKLAERKEERAFQRNKPLFESVNKLRTATDDRETALSRMENSVISGNIRPFLDWAAGELGLDPLKTSDAQILESASKDLLLGNIEGIAGRGLNQFLEKLVRDAGASIGKSPEANQEYLETMYFVNDIQKKYLDEFDKLEQEFDDRGLELPKNAAALLQKRLEPFKKARTREFRQTQDEIRSGKVQSNSALKMRRAKRQIEDVPAGPGEIWMLAPDGDAISVPMSDVKKLQKAGARLVE